MENMKPIHKCSPEHFRMGAVGLKFKTKKWIKKAIGKE